jgi:hypothetical protein
MSDMQDSRALNRNFSEVKNRYGNYEDLPRNMNTDRNPERYDSGYKLPSIGKATETPRIESNIGSNMDAYMSKSELLADRRKGF